MRKISLIAIAFLALFASCSKKNDSDYFVKFSVNGTNKKYTGYTFGHIEISGANKALEIVGTTSATSFDDYMGLYIDNTPDNTHDISEGFYEDTHPFFSVLATYSNGGTDYEAGESVADDAASNSITINHFEIQITNLDDETVSGVFSGDYYADGNVQSGTKLSITNGEFHVKLQ